MNTAKTFKIGNYMKVAFLIVPVVILVCPLSAAGKEGISPDEEKEVRDFIERMIETIMTDDTKGFTRLHHPQGVMNSWSIPEYYDETVEVDSSREAMKRKFPMIQFPDMGDIPEDSFYRKAIFYETTPEYIKSACAREMNYTYVTAKYFFGLPGGFEIEELNSYFSYEGEKSYFISFHPKLAKNGCKLRVGRLKLEKYNGQLYLQSTFFAYTGDLSRFLKFKEKIF